MDISDDITLGILGLKKKFWYTPLELNLQIMGANTDVRLAKI